MVTSQPNSQDQQSTEKLQYTSIVDASHEETIVEGDKFRAKNAQLDLASNPNEVKLDLKTIVMTQPMSTGITIDRQVDKVVQSDLACMLVEYGALGFIHEGGIDPTQASDVECGPLLELDYT
jgi:predicted thioredoxin/glutaredoxin